MRVRTRGRKYLTYAINDRISAKIRGEIWRDDKAFYVAQFADPTTRSSTRRPGRRLTRAPSWWPDHLW